MDAELDLVLYALYIHTARPTPCGSTMTNSSPRAEYPYNAFTASKQGWEIEHVQEVYIKCTGAATLSAVERGVRHVDRNIAQPTREITRGEKNAQIHAGYASAVKEVTNASPTSKLSSDDSSSGLNGQVRWNIDIVVRSV